MTTRGAFMTMLRKFAYLETAERRLLVRTLFLLVVIRFALRVAPFRVLRSLIPHPAAALNGPPTEALLRGVLRAARCIPACSCLERAIALHILLARSGQRSRLTIGFQRGTSARRGHAWVECAGQTFFDDGGPPHYAPAFSIGGLSADT